MYFEDLLSHAHFNIFIALRYMKVYCEIIPMTNLLSKHFYGSKVFSQSRCNVETFEECLIYLELLCITSSLHNLICKYYSAGVNGSKKS